MQTDQVKDFNDAQAIAKESVSTGVGKYIY